MVIITTTGEGISKRGTHNGLESLPPIRRYVQVENDCIRYNSSCSQFCVQVIINVCVKCRVKAVHSYWDYLEASYDWVSTELIGKSFEGQEMRVLKVSS